MKNINKHYSSTSQTTLNVKEWLNGVTMKKLFTSIAVLFLIGWNLGCNSNPVQPSDHMSAPAAAAGQTAQMGSIQLLDVPLPTDISLSKKYWSGKWINAESGGTLTIKGQYNTNTKFKTATLTATFSVPQNALSNNQFILMSFDDAKLQVQFNPHGLQFKVPAKLSYTATGVDLSVLPAGTEIKLFYVDEQSGSFEEMNGGTITYDVETGTVSCTDAEIPHFSEYAFGYIKK
jgi:hypothetical protein